MLERDGESALVLIKGKANQQYHLIQSICHFKGMTLDELYQHNFVIFPMPLTMIAVQR